MNQVGQIRVGRIKNSNDILTFENYIPIVVMTKSSKYGSLGPYVIKNDAGIIIENLWQFSKCYAQVPNTTQHYSQWDQKVIWQHPEEIHAIADSKNPLGYQLTPQYWAWRRKGFACQYAIRYPVGFNHRDKCLFVLRNENPNEPLDYISARKQVYLPEYCKAVKKQPQFQKLKEMLRQGKNLLILEVDGPRQESLSYYKEQYGVDDTFIEQKTMLATQKNLSIMLNDKLHSFGHGYCLAAALLDINL